MKKLSAFAIIATMLIALTACDGRYDRSDVSTDTQTDDANYDNTEDDVTVGKK